MRRGSGYRRAAAPGWLARAALVVAAAPLPAAGVTARADTLPSFVASALSLYRAPPDSSGVAKLLARWGRSGGPASGGDSLALAGLWRRAGASSLALRALPAPREEGPGAARLALERARILFAARGPAPGAPDEAEREATAAFRSACRSMDAPTARELWLDLRGLATPEERAAWDRLAPGPAACAWVERLLAERAWRMAVRPEERLALHYRRLARARELYWIRRPRFTRDLTDALGRPDSLELDDRGLVSLRLGAPHAVSGTAAADLETNETWSYRRPEGTRLFHFAAVSKAFGGGFQPLGDYRLLENLAHAAGLTMTTELMSVGASRIAALYASRAGLDLGFAATAFRYAEAQRRMRSAGAPFDPGFLAVLAQERARTREDARHVVRSVPDVPAVEPRVRFLREALRFEEPDGGAEVWLLVSARAGDLSETRPGEGPADAAGDPRAAASFRYAVRARAALLGPDGYVEAEGVAEVESSRPLEPDDGLTVRLPLRLPPGRWPLAVLVRDERSEPPAGNWAHDTLAVPLGGGPPRLSDLALAPDSGGAWTRDGAVFLSPRPDHAAGPDGALHVYFEAYGVPAGGGYEVEVRLAEEERAARIFDLDPSQLAVGLRFRAAMPGDGSPARHHLRLDLSRTVPGEYRLAVRLTDGSSGAPSLPVHAPVRR